MPICYQPVITSLATSEITYVTYNFLHSFLLDVINDMSYKSTGSLKALQATIQRLTRHSANKSFNNKASNAFGTSKNVMLYAVSTLLQMEL